MYFYVFFNLFKIILVLLKIKGYVREKSNLHKMSKFLQLSDIKLVDQKGCRPAS